MERERELQLYIVARKHHLCVMQPPQAVPVHNTGVALGDNLQSAHVSPERKPLGVSIARI